MVIIEIPNESPVKVYLSSREQLIAQARDENCSYTTQTLDDLIEMSPGDIDPKQLEIAHQHGSVVESIVDGYIEYLTPEEAAESWTEYNWAVEVFSIHVHRSYIFDNVDDALAYWDKWHKISYATVREKLVGMQQSSSEAGGYALSSNLH